MVITMLKIIPLCFYSHFMHAQHFTKYLTSPLIIETKAAFFITIRENISPVSQNRYSIEFKHCLVFYIYLYSCVPLYA